MAYKLPYKGMSRIPSGKGFTINISEDDLKSKKSASPEPAKEISYEGQGGKDYENLPKDAINPEGQGGKDYSDYEDSMSRKASPLNKKNPHPAGTPAHDAFIKREAKNLKESSETMELSKTPEGRKELESRKKDKK